MNLFDPAGAHKRIKLLIWIFTRSSPIKNILELTNEENVYSVYFRRSSPI
jgi:hypothetical protein